MDAMFRLPAHPTHVLPQPEGPELIEGGRADRDASPYANLEASAYRPDSKSELKPRPPIPPKPGVKQLIYVEVGPNKDAKQQAASRTPPEEQVIYSSVDPDRTANYRGPSTFEELAAFQECAAYEEPPADRPPPIPCRGRSPSPQPQVRLDGSTTEAAMDAAAASAVSVSETETESIIPTRVPDEAKRALERTVSTMIQDLARSRPAGPLKVFKSEDSYGARRAMREFTQALDGDGFKKQMLEYERLFPRTDDALPGARKAATEELAATVAMVALRHLSSRQRETLNRHVTQTGGLNALTAMLEKNHGKALATSTCKGLRIAFQDFLTEGAGIDA